jgi:Flp pilus assembly protein TadD
VVTRLLFGRWAGGARFSPPASAADRTVDHVDRGPGPLVRVAWQGDQRAEVAIGQGSDAVRATVRPGRRVVAEAGPWRVRVELVTSAAPVGHAPAWGPPLAWLALVLLTSTAVSQVGVAAQLACPIAGVWCPAAPTSADPPGSTVEILARLLRKDYAGDADQGFIDAPTPPQDAPRHGDAFLPAGDDGPPTRPGGAAVTRDTPDRREAAGSAAPRRAAADTAPTPTPPPAEADAPPAVAEADAPPGDLDDAPRAPADDGRAPSPGRAEEHLGWGVRDWLDASPAIDAAELARRAAPMTRRLAIDPDDPAALSALAYYRYLQEDWVEAERLWDRLIELDPSQSGPYNNKALVYKRTRQWAKEEALYRYALHLDPDAPTPMNNLAINLAHQGRFDEALQLLERLAHLQPGDAYTDFHRCKVYAARGDDDTALAYLRRALHGMGDMDTMHHIEFRADLRLDPALARLRRDPRFIAMLAAFYGADSPVAP